MQKVADTNDYKERFNESFRYIQKGNLEKAYEVLKTCQRECPKDTTVLKRLGEICYKKGNYELASIYFENYLELDPSNYYVKEYLFVCYAFMEEAEKRNSLYQQLMNIDEDHRLLFNLENALKWALIYLVNKHDYAGVAQIHNNYV